MTGEVTSLWRHPIKSHGRESLDEVTMIAGRTMPWDRVWAVAHDASKADGSEWVQCANFSRVSKAPDLMAITARLDEQTGLITLSHPNRDDLNFDPNSDPTAFLSWVAPLVPRDRCLATTSNPETGKRDVDTLAALDEWGHQDFSVRAEVLRGGRIQVGDKVTPL